MNIPQHRMDCTYTTRDGYHVFASSITAYRFDISGDGSMWVVSGGTALNLTDESSAKFIHHTRNMTEYP